MFSVQYESIWLLHSVPGTHCIGGWVGPRAGLYGCGNLPSIGIRSPNRPVHSESLYRPTQMIGWIINYVLEGIRKEAPWWDLR